jgi:hypothetical protein
MEPSTSRAPTPSLGARLLRTLRNLLWSSVLVALAAASVYALSLLNSRTWSLEVAQGKLVVLKGRLLPLGFEPWTPSNPILAEAYAPLDLEGFPTPVGVGARFSEREEIDRVLFTTIEALAQPRVASESPALLDKGVILLRRAEKLGGLGSEQRASLRRLQGEAAFYLARTRLEEARKQLEEALGQLKLAADGEVRHAREASQLLFAIEPQVKRLSEALRSAVHPLPMEGAAPTAPTATPAAEASPAPGAAAADAGTP